jgi:hypothetical protein
MSNVKNPFPTGYKPEIDVTDELDQTLASRYMQLIGILRWAVENGRIDIYLEVSLLSQYQADPRFGHLRLFITSLHINETPRYGQTRVRLERTTGH